MQGVLEGFGVIAVIVLAGVVIGRSGVLGLDGQRVLARVVFYIGTPALMFVTLSTTDVHRTISSALAITAISALVTASAFMIAGTTLLKRNVGHSVIGAWASSYVNAGNLGIPLAVYVLGSAAYVAPVMLFQLIVLAPIGFGILDATLAHGKRWWSALAVPFKNPIVIGTLAGLAVSLLDWHIPDVVNEPIRLVSGLAVPGALLVFGISLKNGWKPPPRDLRRDLSVVVGLKLFLQPVIAYVFGAFVFSLAGTDLFAVTLTAALPTAQNVFIYAMRYNQAGELARDSAFVTTLLAIPVMIVIALLLG